MYWVAIGWTYVVLMMSTAEASASNGSLLGAAVTFVMYGVLPLAIVLYLMATPSRRAARRAAERALDAARIGSADQPDGRDHAAGDAVAAERKEA